MPGFAPVDAVMAEWRAMMTFSGLPAVVTHASCGIGRGTAGIVNVSVAVHRQATPVARIGASTVLHSGGGGAERGVGRPPARRRSLRTVLMCSNDRKGP